MKAKLRLSGKFDRNQSSEWKSAVNCIGPFIYTLPLRNIRQFSLKPLDVITLEKVESSKLSFAQVGYELCTIYPDVVPSFN